MTPTDVEERICDALEARTAGVTGDPASLAALQVVLAHQPGRTRRRRVVSTVFAAAVVAAVAIIAAVLATGGIERTAQPANPGVATVVPGVAYPPDQYFLGSGPSKLAADGTLRATIGVYGLGGGAAVKQLPAPVSFGALSPDGRTVYGVGGSSDGTTTIVAIDLATNAVRTFARTSLTPTGPPRGNADPGYTGGSFYSLSVSADGGTLAYSYQGADTNSQYGPTTVTVRSLRTGSARTYAAAGAGQNVGQVSEMALSPDGKRLAYTPTHAKGQVYYADLSDPNALVDAKLVPVDGCTWPDGGMASPIWTTQGLFAIRSCPQVTQIVQLDPSTGAVSKVEATPTAPNFLQFEGVMGTAAAPLFLVDTQETDNGTTTGAFGIIDPRRGNQIQPLTGISGGALK